MRSCHAALRLWADIATSVSIADIMPSLYDLCRNRHGLKRPGNARAKWLQARSRELLPVPYFHVVFTLPR